MAQITLRDYLQETEDAISNGRVDDALVRCQHVLARFPEVLEAQRLLGEVYLAQGHLDEAQQTFDWVLTNDPENVIVYCDRALISERKSDYDTALDCYQQAYELSRGNSQIRNEFNKLSAKTGQQGFMFSRAGLARLYMRGDLLTQAIQEWEVVLAGTPDRLDARTGLLEAYWREGLYDRVEQLATQLLQDVPGCIKALLLLAYVSSAKDMQLAQDYLRKAEALDPDLVIAQDLFADVMASQPNEPFLKLLKRSPVNIEPEKPIAPPLSAASAGTSLYERDASSAFSTAGQGSSSSSPSLPPISAWAGNEAWSSDTTFVPPPPVAQPEQEAASLPVWSSDIFPAGDSWSAFDKPQESETNLVPDAQSETGLPDLAAYLSGQTNSGESWSTPDSPQPPAQDELQRDPWALPQAPQSDVNVSNGAGEQDSTLLSSQQWNDQSKNAYTPSEDADPWESMKDLGPGDFSNTWSSSPKDVDLASPPAWLNMLTQGERRQMSGDLPSQEAAGEPNALAAQPIVPQAPVSPPAPQEPVSQSVPELASSQSGPKQEAQSTSFPFPVASDEDDEESMFGPAWLKSLGAETIEDELAGAPIPSASREEPAPVVYEEPPVQQSPALYEQTRTTSLREPSALEQMAEPGWEASLAAAQETMPSWESSLNATQGSGPSWESSLNAPQEPTPSWVSSLNAPQEPMPSWEGPSEIVRASQTAEPLWGHSAESTSAEPSVEALWGSVPETLPAVQNEPPQESAKEIEQNLLATLEGLEKNLLSQGFIPLERNSLSAIAQQQEVPPVPKAVIQPEQPAPALEAPGEPTLSSALAELGGFVQPPVAPEKPSIQPPEPIAPAQPAPTPAEPSWLASLRATPVPAPAVTARFPEEQSWQYNAPDAPANPVTPAAPAASTFNPTVPAPVDARASTPTKPVAPVPAPAPRPGPVQAPSARKDVSYFDDMELETTMKRPAIRLPSAQQKSPMPREQVPPPIKGRTIERGAVSKTPDTNLNYRERLVKGYQHQLVGDYDEAMSEYRILIRNAPDLLGEVVSNVRALLKLAPKYSAGYRVLGDAYMRQGEYLQAMEAYNKALTMAKKAKA